MSGHQQWWRHCHRRRRLYGHGLRQLRCGTMPLHWRCASAARFARRFCILHLSPQGRRNLRLLARRPWWVGLACVQLVYSTHLSCTIFRFRFKGSVPNVPRRTCPCSLLCMCVRVLHLPPANSVRQGVLPHQQTVPRPCTENKACTVQITDSQKDYFGKENYELRKGKTNNT